jgi:hypothetical protein
MQLAHPNALAATLASQIERLPLAGEDKQPQSRTASQTSLSAQTKSCVAQVRKELIA